MVKFSKKTIVGGAGILAMILFIAILGGGESNTKVKNNIEGKEALNKEITEESSLNEKDVNSLAEKENSEQKEIERLTAEVKSESKTINTKTGEEQFFKVVKVIDGDTIALENGEVVRYIGIDTPETVHPSKPVQCFGKEASEKNKELVEGKMVRLEKDVSERDKYNRLLRYVWIGDIFVNDYLVREGYAYASTYPPDVKYADQFLKAQQEARERKKGLWAGCEEKNVEKEVVKTTQPATETLITPTNLKDINCSSNVYNCTDFKTHNEAQKVFEYCGGVNNDVHRLDQDKDGIACESLP